MTKILVTGSNGMLGQMLDEVLSENHKLTLTDKHNMDITDKDSVNKIISETDPDFVIHAAAFTAVDDAEDQRELCTEINVEGTRNVATAAANNNAGVIYISTDYVFDGKKESPYTEKDPTDPLSHYGKTKLEGEAIVGQLCKDHYILRVAWLFGENKQNKNFVETMIKLAEKGPVKVINDQVGSPTYTKDLAEIIKKIIEEKPDKGIYHFSGKGKATRFKFAQEIYKQANVKADLESIATKDFFAKAERPAYSYLDKSKIERDLKIKARPWQEMLRDYLQTRG